MKYLCLFTTTLRTTDIYTECLQLKISLAKETYGLIFILLKISCLIFLGTCFIALVELKKLSFWAPICVFVLRQAPLKHGLLLTNFSDLPLSEKYAFFSFATESVFSH